MALFINLFIAEHEHILFVVMQHWHCSVNSHLFNYFVGFFIRNYSPLGLYHFCSLYNKNCKKEISLMLSNFSNLYKITLKWVVIWLKLELNDKYQHLPALKSTDPWFPVTGMKEAVKYEFLSVIWASHDRRRDRVCCRQRRRRRRRQRRRRWSATSFICRTGASPRPDLRTADGKAAQVAVGLKLFTVDDVQTLATLGLKVFYDPPAISLYF